MKRAIEPLRPIVDPQQQAAAFELAQRRRILRTANAGRIVAAQSAEDAIGALVRAYRVLVSHGAGITEAVHEGAVLDGALTQPEEILAAIRDELVRAGLPLGPGAKDADTLVQRMDDAVAIAQRLTHGLSPRTYA